MLIYVQGVSAPTHWCTSSQGAAFQGMSGSRQTSGGRPVRLGRCPLSPWAVWPFGRLGAALFTLRLLLSVEQQGKTGFGFPMAGGKARRRRGREAAGLRIVVEASAVSQAARPDEIHVRAFDSFQQPTSQTLTNNQSWSYSHFKCFLCFK